MHLLKQTKNGQGKPFASQQETMGEERRKFPRYQTSTPTVMVVDDVDIEGTMKNISQGGVCVTSTASLTRDDFLSLNFHLSNGSITCPGRVAICVEKPNYLYMYGIQFFEIEEEEALELVDARDEIQELVIKRLNI